MKRYIRIATVFICVFLFFVLLPEGCGNSTRQTQEKIETADQVDSGGAGTAETAIADQEKTGSGSTDTGTAKNGTADQEKTEAGTTGSGTTEAGAAGTTEAGVSADTTNQVSVVMVGDMLLHTRVQESGLQTDGTYNFDYLFKNITTDIKNADISIVNEEAILGGSELGLSGYPSFNGPFEVGDAIVKAGFDVVLHATNHALDKGTEGILSCLNFWEKNYPDMGILGINDSQKMRDTIYVIEKNNIKIAILNYTFSTNGITIPKDMPYCVNMLDKDLIEKDIIKAKEQADFIIVCPHWGTEYSLEATKMQKDWSQFFADQGVNLVIGTHPHVIEPITWIEGSNGGKMLVYYSIGNFVNATSGTGPGTGNRMVGGMAQITIEKDGKDKAYIKDYGVTPLVTQLEENGKITTYKLSEYSDQLGQENQILKQDPDFSYVYCKELCKKVFGDLYTGD